MGLTPDPQGLLPQGDSIRLKEFGEAVQKLYGHPQKSGKGKGNRIDLKLPEESVVSYYVLQEDIRLGERVRHYRIEARVNGKWQTLSEGESVGHKRIQHFTPVKTCQVRLTVSEAIDLPHILNFSIY